MGVQRGAVFLKVHEDCNQLQGRLRRKEKKKAIWLGNIGFAMLYLQLRVFEGTANSKHDDLIIHVISSLLNQTQ